MEFSHSKFRPRDRIFELYGLWPFTKACDARSSNSVLIQHSPELRRKEGEQRPLATMNQHSQSRGSLVEGRHSYGFCAVPLLAENIRAAGAGGARGIRTHDTRLPRQLMQKCRLAYQLRVAPFHRLNPIKDGF
jgi:hypothetical protein